MVTHLRMAQAMNSLAIFVMRASPVRRTDWHRAGATIVRVRFISESGRRALTATATSEQIVAQMRRLQGVSDLPGVKNLYEKMRRRGLLPECGVSSFSLVSESVPAHPPSSLTALCLTRTPLTYFYGRFLEWCSNRHHFLVCSCGKM